MKSLQNLLLILVACIFFSACQKEASQEPDNTSPTTSNYRLKTYTEKLEYPGLDFTTVYNVNYDNNGRLSSLVSADSPGDKFVLTYPAANRRTLDIFSEGTLTIHSDLFLNAKSLVDSIFQYNDTEDSSTTKYIYDGNNRVITMKDYDYSKRTGSVLSNTISYTYNGEGDMIRSADTDGNEELYEYYSGEKYEVPNAWEISGIHASGKGHLVKKQTIKSGGIVVATFEHTYTFDEKKRVTSDKAISDIGATATKTYTYL